MKKMLLVILLTCLMVPFGVPLFAAEKEIVNVYNWSEYIPDTVLKKFEEETGIKINYSTFDSNETMYAKLKTLKGESYDVAVPSTYFVDRMRKEGMLIKLDKSKIPGFKNIDPKLLNKPYDPDNEYSIPYLWGTTGIALNSEFITPGSVTQWADLWDGKYKNSLLLLDDVRDVFSTALKILGYSINETDEVHIREAYLKLKELMPNVKIFNSETPKVFFIEGEVSLGMNWNGETFKAHRENNRIEYIYPKEGVMIWMDNLVIPKGARNIDNAYKFIEFVLRPDVAKMIAEEIGYATPNLEALKLLPAEIRESRIIYPTEEDLKNSEFQSDVGDTITIYEKYWEMLKVGR